MELSSGDIGSNTSVLVLNQLIYNVCVCVCVYILVCVCISLSLYNYI